MAEKAVSQRSSEIENFLELLYEGQDGYVYCPTKNNQTGYWQPYFFTWPKQKVAIVTHILDATKNKDCYIAPSLFKAPDNHKKAWKGSNYVWIEFDGNAPEKLPRGIPAPTIQIQSSTKGHEHWYWRLGSFETDYRVIETLSKQLTYTLDADKSGWDAGQVLRPPGTLHHDSKRRVTLKVSKPGSVSLADFKDLIDPPVAAVVDTNFDHLPDVQEVISKYKWPDDAFELFKKNQQPVGSRSSAMTRLGFHCIEMGMSNEECYTILLNADDRWGKFKNRSPEDRAKRLVGIITHCRGKKAVQTELGLSDGLAPLMSWEEFENSEVVPPKWLFESLLVERGLGIIAANAGTGKSIFSFNLCLHAVLGKSFLCWQFHHQDYQVRAAFLSFEMSDTECRGLLDELKQGYSEEELRSLRENFYIIPEGSTFDLSNKDKQQEVLDMLLSREINFLVIDSLKAVTNLDDARVDKFFEWINRVLRKEHGITIWLIHHNRKAPNAKDQKSETTLDDVYGSMGITTHPTVVIGLKKSGVSKKSLKVLTLKLRSAPEPDPFYIKYSEHLQYLMVTTKEPDNASGEATSKPNSNSLFGRAD